MIQTQFATSIYLEKISANPTRFNREILEQCYLVRETDPGGHDWSEQHYVNGYTSYGSITDLHQRYPHFEELAKLTDNHVRKFARHLDMDLQGGHLQMSSCWVNIMETNAAHSSHLHPLSVISGTYYVSLPKRASALKFEDPRLSQMMAAPPKLPNARARNLTHISIDPRQGQLALWESYLRHEVPPHRGDEDRVTISFNYDWV